MMKIPLCKTFIGKKEEKEILKVLRSGWLIHGPYVKQFEARFAEYIGSKYAIGANSCTSVLQLSLLGELQRTKKKFSSVPEVILPSFTFVASANSIVTMGLKPVFVDIDPHTFNISAEETERAINKNTFAVMVVHFAGQSCKMDKICKIAKKHKLILIEDSAEGIGSEFKKKRTGSFGTGCFSFFPTKNMTTGEGGALTTNDAELAEITKALLAHGMSGKTKKRHPWNRNAKYAGFNFRMMDLQAAIGVVQLDKLERMNNNRRELAKMLTDEISTIDEIAPPFEDKDCKHVFQMYTPILRRKNISRDKLVQALNKKGIGASVHFDPPVHKQYRYSKEYGDLDLPVTESVSKRIFTLPMYPSLKKSEVKTIAKELKNCLSKLSGK